MRRLECFSLALFLGLPVLAEAGPAPWYKWQSIAGATVCAQTSPGPAWVRLEGRTYVDPRCMRQNQNRAADNNSVKEKK